MYVAVSGLGTLVFLWIVSREILFRNHVLKMRCEAERERKAKQSKEAAERRQAQGGQVDEAYTIVDEEVQEVHAA
jgi:hypothetical protein